MILNLQKIRSRIGIIHNIPKSFFKRLEQAEHFGDHLFPTWANEVFKNTDLQSRFEAVYNSYKALPTNKAKASVIQAFTESNKIEELCNNLPDVNMILLTDLHLSIRAPLDKLFAYLYNVATKYPAFEQYTQTSIFKSIDKFIKAHKIQICPLCGLETYLNIEGQPRLPLDHWLSRDIFPYAAVNFNNLIPIGKDCNSNGVKGFKNILIDNSENNQRVVAYYPFSKNEGVTAMFKFLAEPTIDNEHSENWEFVFILNEPNEENIYESWNKTFNIKTRYNDFVRKNVLGMWESEYKSFIEEHEILEPAKSLEDFKDNLQHWKSSFNKKSRPGSLAFISFIDNLLRSPNSYLTGLYKTFYSEYIHSSRIS